MFHNPMRFGLKISKKTTLCFPSTVQSPLKNETLDNGQNKTTKLIRRYEFLVSGYRFHGPISAFIWRFMLLHMTVGGKNHQDDETVFDKKSTWASPHTTSPTKWGPIQTLSTENNLRRFKDSPSKLLLFKLRETMRNATNCQAVGHNDGL